MFFWEFAFCLFRNWALMCTWIGIHLKETIPWGNTGSEMMQKRGNFTPLHDEVFMNFKFYFC